MMLSFFGPIPLFFWAVSKGILWVQIAVLVLYLIYIAVGIWLRWVETHCF